MSVQLVHEAEHHRQHARYRIPANIVIGNDTYRVAEWSVAGLSVENLPDSVPKQTDLNATLQVDFEVFKAEIPLQIEVLRNISDDRTACRFVKLGTEQISLFHQIINSFLAGEVVQVGEVLNVISREGMTAKDFSERLKPDRTTWENLVFHLKRITGFAFFAIVILSLLAFIGTSVYDRFFVITSVSAKVGGQVTTIRAPDNGFYQEAESLTSNVNTGQLLGIVKLISGGASAIESPCDCSLVDKFVTDGIFVGKGEPVFSILSPGTKLNVVAQIDFDDVKKIRLGQTAKIQLTSGEFIEGRVQRVLANQTAEQGSGAGADTSANARAKVLIEPNRAIPVAHLNSVAHVTIDTFSQSSLQVQ
ncbi:MAG: HlyD family efflux transporter periplasmic adaptor subunit [Aestuariibacter sp.]